MSVMNALQTTAGMGSIPAPPGAMIPGNLQALLGNLMAQLNLRDLGVYTPWATYQGGTSWLPVEQPPDTSIGVAALTDALWRAATQAAFGQPLPFVAVLSDAVPPQLADSMTEGTQYQLYETQGVYSQADKDQVPRILFLTWLQLRNPEDPDKGNGSLEQLAQRLGGRLVYAAQHNYDTTAQRAVPPVSFGVALENQLRGGTDPGHPLDPIDPEIPIDPPPSDFDPPPKPQSAGINWTGVLIGGALAVGGFLVVRKMRD